MEGFIVPRSCCHYFLCILSSFNAISVRYVILNICLNFFLNWIVGWLICGLSALYHWLLAFLISLYAFEIASVHISSFSLFFLFGGIHLSERSLSILIMLMIEFSTPYLVSSLFKSFAYFCIDSLTNSLYIFVSTLSHLIMLTTFCLFGTFLCSKFESQVIIICLVDCGHII